MATQDVMTKTTNNSAIPQKMTQPERRGSRRCKINQLMRIRPSDPEKEHFEDLRGTTSVSRTGVAFHTSETGYEIGMRLFVTMPYSRDPSAINREYLAEVVRLEALPNGLNSVGIKLLMEMGMQHSYSFTPPPARK
jgi:PilZ domain